MKKLSIKFFSLVLISTIIFSFLQVFFINSEVNAAISSEYTQYIKSGIGSFPESYQIKLAYLKWLHPNWEFKAYYTGIDWNELTSTEAENRCMVNTIHKGTVLDPAALCRCGTMGDYGYYCASRKAVNYYLDPRNFMSEAMIFQFLDLANTDGVSRSVVDKTVRGTYLEQYSGDIYDAALESGISPLHIIATIFQELGRENPSRIISGTVPGYEGLYNFYNFGATDGEGNIERGLEKARELGWTTPRFALIDGAKRVLASNYVAAGQTTKYFYKFDVVPNQILKESDGVKTFKSNSFYNHQYMTNLRDPAAQAGTLYNIYETNGVLDQKLTFMIPVYNNMPEQVAEVPTSLQATPEYALFYINTMFEGGVVLRTNASSTSSSLGTLYKGTIVLHMGYEGSYSKVKIIKATEFNTETREWNYEEQIGYVSSQYVAKLGSYVVPDYRDQVDMGSGSGGNIDPDVPSESSNFKIAENNIEIVMTPTVTVKDIKNKYENAIIKIDDKLVSEDTTLIPTGAVIQIGDEVYTAIKLGDLDRSGEVDIIDLALIKRHMMGTIVLEGIDYKAAKLQYETEEIDIIDMALLKRHLMGTKKITI